MVTASWKVDDQPAQTFVLPTEGLASLEAYRLSLTKVVRGESGAAAVPVYATVLDMLIASVTNNIIRPAFMAFPPDSVKTAAQAVDTAKTALAAAQEAALAAALQPNSVP